MTLEDLQKQMAEAVSKNDIKAMEQLAEQIVAGKKERIKAEAEAARKEAEALAGEREAFEKKVYEAIKALNLDAKLLGLKCKSFTYTANHKENADGKLDANGEVKVTGAVKLHTPAVKSKKSSGGNGSSGKTKDEFGMSLQEVFEKFATDDERTKLENAVSNSVAWQIKNQVKKRAISEGLIQPAK